MAKKGVKLLRAQVRKQLLLNKEVENFIEGVADGIKSRFDGQKHVSKSEVEVQQNRKSRCAVDVVVDRTFMVVKNHTLEKVVESL